MAFNPGRFGGSLGDEDDDYMSMFDRNAQSFDGLIGDSETAAALEADQSNKQLSNARFGSKALGAYGDYVGAKAYAQSWLEQTRQNQRAAQRRRSGNIFGQIVGGLASNIPVVGPLIGGAFRGGFS